MQFYTRITEALEDKGFLVPVEEYEKTLDEGFVSENDQYASVYMYNQSQFEQFEKTGSVKGIRDVVTNKLVFDFDNKEDQELARKDTTKLLAVLASQGVRDDNIELYWSGYKGFTVTVRLDRNITPEAHSALALDFFGKSLTTLDKGVYNASRILRVPNSKHQVSNLYKVKLTPTQVKTLDVDKIKSLAAVPGGYKKAQPVKLKDELFVVKAPLKEKKEVALVDLSSVKTSKPKHWKLYKWALVNAVAVKSGERHSSMMVIAATCRGYGYTRDITEGFLNQFDEKYAANTKQEEKPSEVKATLDSVFHENWQGGQYNIENNPWLRDYARRIGVKDAEDVRDKVMNIAGIEEGFTDYVKNIEANTITVGIPALDRAMPITTGMNLGIVGAASSGKTALALEILKNTSQKDVISVFVSLDMHRNRLFTKLIMKVTGYDLETVYSKFKNGDKDEIMAKLKKEFGNVWFYDRSGATVEKIRDYIDEVEEITGKKVKLVMVDYFERVNSERSDETAASKDIAGKLQDLVNDKNIAMITLVQPNKFSLNGGPDQPILSYTAIKGSSYLYQSFRGILSIWRPFFNPEWQAHDKYMQMALLKNDLGELGVLNFSWNGRKGEIKECTNEQAEEMQELIDKKRQAEAAKKNGGGWD